MYIGPVSVQLWDLYQPKSDCYQIFVYVTAGPAQATQHWYLDDVQNVFGPALATSPAPVL